MKKIPVRSAARRNGSKPRSVKQTSFFSSLDAAMQRGWALGDMYDRSGAPEIVRVRRTRHEEGAATIEPRETKQPVAAEPSAPAPASANTANQSSTAIAAAAPKPTAPRGTLVSSQSKTVKRMPTAAPAAVHKRAKNHRRAVGAAMAGIVSSVFTKPTAALHAGGESGCFPCQRADRRIVFDCRRASVSHRSHR